MNFLKDGRSYLLKLSRGEEVISTLRAFVLREKIPGGSLTGLGAADEMTVAFYHIESKTYRTARHEGLIEICSLTGNIAWRGEEPVVHVHVMAAHEKEGAFGGHLSAARVLATVEIMIEAYERRVVRTLDEAMGLPLLDLPSA